MSGEEGEEIVLNKASDAIPKLRYAEDGDGDENIIKFSHGGNPYTCVFTSDATVQDLSDFVELELEIPGGNQKFLISPKPGMLRPPFGGTAYEGLLLTDIRKRKITLLGSTQMQIDSLNKSIETSKQQRQRRMQGGPVKAATPAKSRDWKRMHDDTTYTFLQIRPLDYLPRPERSREFLERLRDDPGIKASMAKHKWTVPLLTEMNPAEHTTHESKTLGLNRNHGEVIELRLRTDAYDGYRNYKVIRKTLCHELAHNEFGEHDRNFWDLCHQIEREVEQADWKSGGRALTDEIFYDPATANDSADGDAFADHGGWTGGEFVLGGASSGSSSNDATAAEPLSRREILARAADERAKRTSEQQNRKPPPDS